MTDAPKVKKKLTIISSYEYVDTNATKARLGAYLSSLKADYKVTFICPKSDEALNINDVSIIQAGRSPVYGNFFSRALREIVFAIKTVPIMLSSKPDISIVTIPSMFLLLTLVVKRSPIIVDVRDLVWEYLPENTRLKRLIKSAARSVMLSLINKADAVFVTNEREQEYISHQIIKPSVPVKVVRNGINQERFQRLSKLALKRNNSKFTILYIGNIGQAQNLRVLVDAMKSTLDARAVIVGKGNELEKVRYYAIESGVENIEFVGGVEWGELESYYKNADVLYAQISADYQSAVPSKLYEYLSVGLPVIFAGVGASSDLMKMFDNVTVILPDDSFKLEGAIAFVKDSERKEISTMNQDLIQSEYVREAQVRNVLSLISGLAS